VLTTARRKDIGNDTSYPIGWKVTFRQRPPFPAGTVLTGKIAGKPLRDPLTETCWVPVATMDAPDDQPPQWVRHTDILDVSPFPTGRDAGDPSGG